MNITMNLIVSSRFSVDVVVRKSFLLIRKHLQLVLKLVKKNGAPLLRRKAKIQIMYFLKYGKKHKRSYYVMTKKRLFDFNRKVENQ